MSSETVVNQSKWSVPSWLLPDEAGYVDVREGGHQVLAVESIHDAAMSGDGAGKVLQRSDSGAAGRQPNRASGSHKIKP